MTEPAPVVDFRDNAAVVSSVRAWLMSNVEHGRELRIAQIGIGASGNAYVLVDRLRDAGIVERVGAGPGSYHVVHDHERVLDMTDDELLLILWPHGRKSGAKAKASTPPLANDDENLDEQITPEMAQTFYPQESSTDKASVSPRKIQRSN